MKSLLTAASVDPEADDGPSDASEFTLSTVPALTDEADGDAAPNLQEALHTMQDGSSLQSTITLLVQEREAQDKKLKKALSAAQALKKLAERAITKKNQLEGAKAAEEKLFQVSKGDLESQMSQLQDKIATLEEMVQGLNSKQAAKSQGDLKWKKEKAKLEATILAERREVANRTRTLHQMTGAAAKLKDFAMKFRDAEAKAEREKAAVAQQAARQKTALEAYVRQVQQQAVKKVQGAALKLKIGRAHV